MTILVTGGAGFIGAHLVKLLIDQGIDVIAIDSFTDYYSTELKELRWKSLTKNRAKILRIDLTNESDLNRLFKRYKPKTVVNLAAQAGVRLLGKDLDKYFHSNIEGFYRILSVSIRNGVENFLFASSSSVYGNSNNDILSEVNKEIQPISFYGATKLFNEISIKPLVRDSQMRAIGMRFFTVYGPWGRPDMAYFRIAANLLSGKEFKMYGNGDVRRDFTYVDDVIQSIFQLSINMFRLKPGQVEFFNVGGGKPISLNDLITLVEQKFDNQLNRQFLPPNYNDVKSTNADFSKLFEFTGFRPQISFSEGLDEMAPWFTRNDISKRLDNWISSTV